MSITTLTPALTVFTEHATPTKPASLQSLALPTHHTYHVPLHYLCSWRIHALFHPTLYAEAGSLLSTVQSSFTLCVWAGEAVVEKDFRAREAGESAALPSSEGLRIDEIVFEQKASSGVGWIGESVEELIGLGEGDDGPHVKPFDYGGVYLFRQSRQARRICALAWHG